LLLFLPHLPQLFHLPSNKKWSSSVQSLVGGRIIGSFPL
jgi:hypothetical protein